MAAFKPKDILRTELRARVVAALDKQGGVTQ